MGRRQSKKVRSGFNYGASEPYNDQQNKEGNNTTQKAVFKRLNYL
jgi:hypothetical protein